MIVGAWRLLAAGVLLTPVYLVQLKQDGRDRAVASLRNSVLPGILLAVHLVSWAAGARMTPATNGSLIVNMVPISMPFLLYIFLRERVNAGEIRGTVVAMLGLFLLTSNDLNLEPEYFLGDLTCFASMLVLTVYLVCARKAKANDSLWLYVVPLYYFAGLVCFVGAFFVSTPIKVYPVREVGLLTALAVIPTVVGHSIFNRSMHVLSGQVVSVLTMGQFVFAGIMAWILFSEIPALVFYPASVLVICGGAMVAHASDARKNAP